MTWFLAVSLLAIGLVSCTKTKEAQTDTSGTYAQFTPIPQQCSSIDTPSVAWTYHWPENYKYVLEASSAPATDNQGNCYFTGCNGYLYSVNPQGEIRWNKENSRGRRFGYYLPSIQEKVIVTEEGVIAKSGGIQLISLDGEFIWKKEDCRREFFLSPNGTLFCFTNDGNLIGINPTGETMWSIPISPDYLVDGGFFDTSSNGYFFVFDFNSTSAGYYLLKVSSTGEEIWKKNLPPNRLEFITDFLPNNPVNDTFLLAYSTVPYPSSDEEKENFFYKKNQGNKILKAYNLNYELQWEKTISMHGIYEGNYAIDNENNLYTFFDENDYSGEYSSFAQSHLTCYSKDGDELWKQTFENEIAQCPTLDKDINLYIWLTGSDYQLRSFTAEGTPRWKLHVDQAYGCKYPITLSPTGEIYTTSFQQSLLFCVK